MSGSLRTQDRVHIARTLDRHGSEPDRTRIVDAHAPRTPIAYLLGAASVLALPYVLATCFSNFLWFDDEGTLLVWFRALAEGHRMYDEVYSLYGPLYGAVYGLIYKVAHVPVTHTSGRLIAAGLWLGYTAGFALLCFRLTGSLVASAASYLLTLVWLAPLMNTPGHPEELGLLLMVAGLLLVHGKRGHPSSLRLAALAAVIAGLALVKVNFGAFVGGGVGIVLVRATPSRAAQVTGYVLATTLLLLPAATMLLLADQAWVRHYWLFATLVIGSALLVFSSLPVAPAMGGRGWALMVVVAASTCMTIVGGLMLAGSSFKAILDATVLQNARFIRNWNIPLEIGPQGMLSAAASITAALAYTMSAERPDLVKLRNWGLSLLKAGCVMGGLVLMTWPGQPFRVLMPFSWLLMTTSTQQALPRRGRCAVAMVGTMMSLYAFPVAGGQVIIGGLVMVALLPVLAMDAASGFKELGFHRRLSTLASPLIVATVLALGTGITARAVWSYIDRVPLGLPGTAMIRLDPSLRDDLRWITTRLSTCNSSYSLPNLSSFSFWTGQPLLSPMNINGTLNFLSSEQQEELVRALDAERDLCVLYYPRLIKFFDRGQVRNDPPLLRYIQENFHKDAERHGYQILKRNKASSS